VNIDYLKLPLEAEQSVINTKGDWEVRGFSGKAFGKHFAFQI
jgi:hypothetical protein